MGRTDPARGANEALAALILAAASLAIAAAGCDQRPPPPPTRDAGPRSMDGGQVGDRDAGSVPISRRPDGGSRLPPADEEIVLPYLGDAVDRDLEVEGEVGRLDVFFSIDTTGSFSGEIDNLQADLSRRIVPELRSRVSDVAFGVGRFEDFPSPPFGASTDRPFTLLSPITDDDTAVATSVASLDQPLGDGQDVAEAGAEALYQIATGEGFDDVVAPFNPAGALGDVGGVGFRSDALRVVVHVTDAPTHAAEDYRVVHPGAHGLADAIEALADRGVRSLGVASGEPARPYLEQVAAGTGAVIEAEGGFCGTGVNGSRRPATAGRCPLVFDINPDGSGLADAVVDAITDLLANVQYDEVWGETDDRLGFVQAIEAVEAIPPAGVMPPSVDDRRPPGDGIDDTFVGVRPGTRVRFRAVLRNTTIPPADYDQIFNLELRVVGDGVTLLRRRLRIVVPRGRLDGGAPDGGAPDAGNDAGASDAGEADAGAPDAGAADAGGVDAG